MSKTIKQIDLALLEQLSQRANRTTRLRSHFNIHDSHDEPVQRFLNVMQPGTYVQPHRHSSPPKWELTLVLSGRALILLFDNDGRVTHRFELLADGPLRAIEIPAATWHTVLALQPATALLELKEGPFIGSKKEKDFATWAPAEGDSGVDELLERLTTASVGDRLA